MEKLTLILKEKKARNIGLLIAVLYLFLYLFSIRSITLEEEALPPSVQLVEAWSEKVFKTSAPFVWESIAVTDLGRLRFFFSPLNFSLALILTILVFLNSALAIFSYSLSKVCRLRPGFHGLLGMLPSFFSGFVCCVPTFLIALGPALASFTVLFIRIRPFLLPASFLAMIVGLIWSVQKIRAQDLQYYNKRGDRERSN